jgi:flagellar FliL protein
MADKAEAKEAKKSGGGLGKLFPMIFFAVNLGVTLGGAYLVYASTLGWETPKITEDTAKVELSSEVQEIADHPLVYTMEKFTVNLSGEPRRTIRLEVNLHMLNEDGFEEVVDPDNRARARDSVVRILNSKEFSDLETIQGKLFLKDQISVALNGLLHEGVVKDVYFTDFVVQ